MPSENETPEEPKTSSEWDALNKELLAERQRLVEEAKSVEERLLTEPTHELETHLKRVKRSLDRVTVEIVDKNQGLVRQFVSQFTKKATPEEREDYFSAGMTGLVEAVVTFEPSKGKFASWAYLIIQRDVLKTLHRGEHSSMSARDFAKRKPVLAAYEKLQRSADGAEPSLDEVAEIAGVKADQVRRITKGMGKTWGKKRAAKRNNSRFDEPPLDPIEVDATWEEVLKEMMRELEPLQRKVFIRYQGLDGWPAENFEEIGRWLRIGRERARREYAKSIETLKAHGWEFPDT
jgi:RNA polymerase sigma factor (sigma-70 family)